LTSAAELVPPRASSEQSDSFRAKHIAALQQCEPEVEKIVQTAFADLQQQVRSLTIILGTI